MLKYSISKKVAFILFRSLIEILSIQISEQLFLKRQNDTDIYNIPVSLGFITFSWDDNVCAYYLFMILIQRPNKIRRCCV